MASANPPPATPWRHVMQPSIDVSDLQDRPPAGRQRIFVVEDDEDISRLIRHNLLAAGYDVQNFLNGNDAVSQAQREQPSLFLLDVMLPGSDGFDLCRQIRQDVKLAKIPIIFLTARTDEADRVKGLELGGDDYITKPFSPRELVARVRAVLRSSQEGAGLEVLKLGHLEIDTASMIVRVKGTTVSTTTREFRLLDYLARHS